MNPSHMTALKTISCGRGREVRTCIQERYINEVWAKKAAAVVNDWLRVGRGNDELDIAMSLGLSWVCVDSERSYNECKRTDPTKDTPNGCHSSTEKAIHEYAETVKENACGNCEEFSIVAFDFLRRSGVKNIELMLRDFIHPMRCCWPLEPLAGESNHAFVVLGRDPESMVESAMTWGFSAFICDPWKPKEPRAYPASELDKYWGRDVKRTRVIYPNPA